MFCRLGVFFSPNPEQMNLEASSSTSPITMTATSPSRPSSQLTFLLLAFFGFVLLHSASPPSLSSFSSRSFQRRTCSWRIFRKSVFFWSSLRASSTSGSMYMSFKICCSMLAADWCGFNWPGGQRRGRGVRCPLGQQLLEIDSFGL